ncbi:MAG TPA: CmpA/NrtA family ABC transporter substrate-binding protein [Pseudoxanthomonas sp.]|nr:CmpA/NrtA family ABC transporter substrate-binding protein [Pseudoxanthomonas sp.]
MTLNHSDGIASQRPLRLGFMPLIDCAPLVAAVRLQLDRKHGLHLQLHRQASWAAIRDKLLTGELDAAHALTGLVHGVQSGVGGVHADLSILLTLNRNGQGIVLSHPLAQALSAGQPLAEAFADLRRPPVLAQTFPTGTHAMWLYYWLAAQGVSPLHAVRSVAMPPPQMADALARGELDGYCAGEPWAQQAETLQVGRRVVASGEIWPDHPEKVLACRRDFATQEPETAVALTATLLEACRWLDEPGNRDQAAAWLAEPEAIGLPVADISACLSVGDATGIPRLSFHDGGAVNFPYLSDGLWFLSQFRRWGWLAQERTESDWARQVAEVHGTARYREAAASVAVQVPAAENRRSVLCDGIVWDGHAAQAYADAFAIRE